MIGLSRLLILYKLKTTSNQPTNQPKHTTQRYDGPFVLGKKTFVREKTTTTSIRFCVFPSRPGVEVSFVQLWHARDFQHIACGSR